ncbi:MAG: haloacid dehalogenase [Actinobacteria bacterium]|nr:MAG: haloacid dehalogenase [Actinomycetota bacterium]
MAAPLDLSSIESAVRSELDTKYAARELSLRNSRPIIRNSANAIRALHRGERDLARTLMDEVKNLIAEAEAGLDGHWDIYHAGFFYDAVKEYAEAELTAALLDHEPLPSPADLGIHAVPYLKGLGEAVGEQRRRLLDQLRRGDLDGAERTFEDMEVVHDLLTSLDYPDGMTSGLRRTTDVARSLIERSRADLTSTIVQERLRRQLEGES